MNEENMTLNAPSRASKKIMTRSTYSVIFLIFFVSLFFLNIASGVAQRAILRDTEPLVLMIESLISASPAILVFCFAYVCMTRRLRDCGQSPNKAWFILIPLFNICYCVYLCFPRSKRCSV